MIPSSASQRWTWAQGLVDQAAYFDLHGGTPFAQALGLPLSFAAAYLESSVHQQHVKAREIQQRNDLAVVGRLDVVIKAISGLARALSRRR